MKEATGELSGTVITVVAIAAVAAIFTVFVLPTIRTTISRRTKCPDADCSACAATEKTCMCKYYDENNKEESLRCDNPNYAG